MRVTVVGDRKTPPDFELEPVTFLNLQHQKSMDSELAPLLPFDSYSRKMLGYLSVLGKETEEIYESDDDNSLNEHFFEGFPSKTPLRSIAAEGICNHYRLFSDEHIWPRGFPLEQILGAEAGWSLGSGVRFELDNPSAQLALAQFLANGNPDVDAIFRLTSPVNLQSFQFLDATPAVLSKNKFALAPVNSQVTIWRPAAFELMYLPVTCSFRMTDIWRGFIAQRVLFEMGLYTVFMGVGAFQDRNDHRLLADFELEVEGYLGYQKFFDVISRVEIAASSVSESMTRIYSALIEEGFFERVELEFLEAWCRDVAQRT